MAIIKNLSQLKKELHKRINESLKNEVYEEVRNVYQKNIDETIFDSYKPMSYKRRDTPDGLGSDENIVQELDENTSTLNVLNIAEPNKSVLGTEYTASGTTTFAGWIENGNVPNIFNDNDYSWMHPRPFTQNTIDDLDTNKQHVEALKQGLKKRGLKVN